MKYLVSLIGALVILPYSAQTFYEQLCDFNYNWEKYADRAPKGDWKSLSSDDELVALHLEAVIPILKSNPTEELTPKQLQSRNRLINMLDGYRIAGRFPQNYYREERIPVFIDQHNTHCAVGYLMQQSGAESLARDIAANSNYAWVKELDSPGVLEWQKRSGFTLEELKLIQGAYDVYIPNALYLPNRYEVPQKPEVMLHYFEDMPEKLTNEQKEKYVWCYGEGEKGKLNGRWVQNYAVGKPWIVGWYQNNKRTGQWKEYYQGTKKLCRTEVWRDDKLNGIRKRWNREGDLIEEILFKDGNAVVKTNYDYQGQLKMIRRPLDSNLVHTEVFTIGGALLASGYEQIHNPGNLQWFQNIELTALNMASISSKSIGRRQSQYDSYGELEDGTALYNQPPLVEYHKVGDWIYYKDYDYEVVKRHAGGSAQNVLRRNYATYGEELYSVVKEFATSGRQMDYDSIKISYSENLPTRFLGFTGEHYAHFYFQYHDQKMPVYQRGRYFDQIQLLGAGRSSRYMLFDEYSFRPVRGLKEVGELNMEGKRIGEWRHYNAQGALMKTVNYLIPTIEVDFTEVKSHPESRRGEAIRQEAIGKLEE